MPSLPAHTLANPTSGTSTSTAVAVRPDAALPVWPVAALFSGYALWWLLGILDVVLIPIAVVMVLYLARTPGLRAPRGFGLWLLFLLWAACSVVELTQGVQLIGFGFRYLVYASSPVVFLYVYNARAALTAPRVLSILTTVWLTTVVGGYLGVFFPTAVVHTPMSYVRDAVESVVSGSAALLNNELITHMVVRRFSQYNPGSFFNLSPRPAAPFRYTNNWGNAYSVLLPLVVAHAVQISPRRRRLLLFVVLPLSAVPAFLTLNRGMLIGIGIAMAYSGFRLLRLHRPKPLMWMVGAAVVGYVMFTILPTQERIDTRLANEGSSNDTRSSLYIQSLDSVPQSPVFGHGVPKEGDNPNAPPVGTQGQVWMILVSHG